ncbi:hypothetical protein N657DRAFT_671245 [Parathielavia appendiculata]|uniref:Uncharacterized protein n=1 Tax=Parathielavia appendiculata TaxID=2587402 RepID=A0AAN6U119_9PEZI|nr:hypothetical protein N657DRAFT_671245 [Parathielavia appendiculata]
MKFGHAFLEALASDSYPQHWVDKAIHYRQLKKILAKVRDELIRNGYDPDRLHQLLADHNAEYRLETDGASLLRPKLVVRPSLSTLSVLPDHRARTTATEPRLSPEAGAEAELGTRPSSASDDAADPAVSGLPEPGQDQDHHHHHEPRADGGDRDEEWVKIPLNSDARFFGLLQAEVTELDSLQSLERQSMNDQIHALGNQIAGVAKPHKGLIKLFKSDLYRWRDIFELYLAAQVFFSTNEAAGGVRKSEKARKQLVWFQDEVNKRGLPQKFKIQSSAVAYNQFLALNATLLQNLQFQELNQTAITKIIKKFDKRTSLGVKTTFPKIMYSAHFISEAISKDICAQLAREVISVVPQLLDYTCPICYSISWLPVRLDCDHLFCIRCMIKLQNQNKRFCPLCRADVVQRANENHIDEKLVRYLERWFPKETQEKQRQNEFERRKELYGIYATDPNGPQCTVM